QISLKGVAKDDFTMILGYPGSTNRYMTSYGVKELLQVENPDRIKIRGARQEILTHDMNADPVVRIKYSDKYSTSSNYWKYSIGQDKGLVTLDVIEKKQAEEEKFRNWVNADPDRNKKYGRALPLIKDAIESRKYYQQAMQYINEALLQSTELLTLPLSCFELYTTLKGHPDSLRAINQLTDDVRVKARKFFKDYNLSTDRKIAAVMFKLYYDNVNQGLRPTFLNEINSKKYKGNYDKYVDELYKKTFFDDSVKLMRFLSNPTLKGFEKDEAFEVAISIAQTYWGMIDIVRGMEDDLNRGNRLYIEGLREMEKDKVFYPDANFTMRMTYGEVGDYDPRDAVHYNYFTTLKGVMEKEDTSNLDFIVPQKLKDLYKDRDYGVYGNNGVMPVCFTTNNDITGGNSGSPVMNGKGELVGLAFDGNWEAMSGDIIYEPELQKTICVDIRYVLFIMDKFAGAKYLVDEMTINQSPAINN
ncbi:MAG TPA: S46 family peptidase, partial [Bacteroidales bacterium]